jgi:hypothetical protein
MSKTKEKLNTEFEKEIKKLNEKLNSLNQKSKKISLIRFIVFLAGLFLFLGFYINNYKDISFISASLFGLIFIFLVVIHNKVEKSIKKFKTFIQIKNDLFARSKLDWTNIPYMDEFYSTNSNYIEQDLNITEKNGLLHLINTGVAFESVQILRKWLSGKVTDISEIISRQNIIRELKNLNHFRNRLLLTTKLSIKNTLPKVEIADWIKNSNKKKGLLIYSIFLFVLSVINIFLFIGSLTGFFNTFYYQLLLLYIIIYFAGFKYIKDIQSISEILYDEVRKFSSIFRFIEEYNYSSNKSLQSFISPITNAKIPPSKLLGEINLTIEILNLRGNPFVWFMLIFITPLDYLISIKVEKFRESIKNDFPIWLKTWHNLEAYSSLATFAYLNPDYQFAEFDETKKLLRAQNLGHPLIKHEQKIKNDFCINESAQTNIITGSNMSGKSTFLRTLGINILLGYAGSVVDAEKLVLSNFGLYTCIKVSDSVVDGISYFYAEVKRLKQIIEEIKISKSNSLVLIDEIYKGTNNVERIIGSKALIKYLSDEKIYNVVSTHDLELVKIADEIKSAKNYHFKEMIKENKMIFDFKLTEGPCPSTNALKIMNIEGLPT